MAEPSYDIINWLKGLPKGSRVGIDDGGLALRCVADTSLYYEIGGLPEDAAKTHKLGDPPCIAAVDYPPRLSKELPPGYEWQHAGDVAMCVHAESGKSPAAIVRAAGNVGYHIRLLYVPSPPEWNPRYVYKLRDDAMCVLAEIMREHVRTPEEKPALPDDYKWTTPPSPRYVRLLVHKETRAAVLGITVEDGCLYRVAFLTGWLDDEVPLHCVYADHSALMRLVDDARLRRARGER